MKRLLSSLALIAGSMVSASALADATTICSGGAAGVGTAPTVSATPGSTYMVRQISPKCSANVHLLGTDGTGGAWYAVGAASAKGKSSFKGNTNGGAVAIHAACAIPGGCTATEATAARTQANTDAGAS
jgi:hypothetical protein